MSHVTHFLRYEFRRFKGRSRIALVFILLVPLLYAGLYLGANWDLYGHIDDIKVAVVNQDEPVDYQGQTVDAGAQFVEALKDRPVFDWQFLDTPQEAADGLREGTYFMTITVPKDFSSRLVSAGSLRPERAVIQMRRDDANGFVIGSLTSKAEDALAKTLDSTVADAYFRAMFGSLEEIRQGMIAAADGAKQLDDGLAQVASGVSQMHDEVQKAAAGTDELQAAVQQIDQSMAGLEGSVVTLTTGTQQVRRGLTQVGTASAAVVGDLRTADAQVQQLTDHALTTLPRMRAQVGELVDAQEQIRGDGKGIVEDMDHRVGLALAAVDAVVAAHPELGNDADIRSLRERLAAIRGLQTDLATQTANVSELAATLRAELDGANLDTSAKAVRQSMADARESAGGVADGVQSVSSGIDTIDSAVQQGQEAMAGAGASLRTLLGTAPGMLEGVVRLSDALGQLNTAMPQLSDGAHQLATGLDEGLQRLPQLTDEERDNLAVAMSQPVDFDQQVDNDAGVYGRGVAPMFLSMGMWIVTVSGFLVVRTISGRALTGRGNPLRITATGLGPISAVALAGAWVMGLGVWGLLGLDPVHPFLFLLLITVASLSFIALGYVFRLLMGSPQTAVFLVWLILQLPSSGGTFPPQMLPEAFQALTVVSPMYYAVCAFRVAISGGQFTTYWMCIAVLLGILIVSVIGSVLLVRRRQRFRMRDLHPPMVTSESTADFAFSVRPR